MNDWTSPAFEALVLAAAIRIVLAEKKLSVAALAEKLDLNRKTVYTYLRGECPASQRFQDLMYVKLAEIRNS
jgi:transcriptional regulator with XRE-family HTH domain